MKRVSLILFLMLVALANLVFAADWHEPVSGDSVSMEEAALEPVTHGTEDTSHGSHPHPPGGSCVHSHSCHAHAHLFSVDTDGYSVVVIGHQRWKAEHRPLPPQHFMAPDVPPPISSRV